MLTPSGPYDLVLTDSAMPGMRGEDLAAQISRVQPGFAGAADVGLHRCRALAQIERSQRVSAEAFRDSSAARRGSSRDRGINRRPNKRLANAVGGGSWLVIRS